MKAENYSVFEYQYRDASNYKAHGELLIQGKLSDMQIAEIRSHFESREFFCAEPMGIPTLYHELLKYSGGFTCDDHQWHEFCQIRPAIESDLSSLQYWGNAEELLARAHKGRPPYT